MHLFFHVTDRGDAGREGQRGKKTGDPREENLRATRVHWECAFVYARTRVILAGGRWFRAFGHLALLREKKNENEKERERKHEGREMVSYSFSLSE